MKILNHMRMRICICIYIYGMRMLQLQQCTMAVATAASAACAHVHHGAPCRALRAPCMEATGTVGTWISIPRPSSSGTHELE